MLLGLFSKLDPRMNAESWFGQARYVRRCSEKAFLDRQAQLRFATPTVAPVLQRQGAAVGFCNLAAQNQADARTARFGGKEGNKEICGVGNARALIKH